jgi:transcription antitermination factor NusG
VQIAHCWLADVSRKFYRSAILFSTRRPGMEMIPNPREETVQLVQPEPVRNWFALHTSSNHEKKVQQHLRMREIESFLPLYTVSRRWKNRVTAKVDLPLFAGYVFVRIARTECSRVLAVPLVHSLVGNGREAIALPDAEIEALRTGLQGRQADPYPYLKVGDLARIRSGALAGMQGVVVRKDGQFRVVLSIELIKRSIAVHVAAEELDLCGQMGT